MFEVISQRKTQCNEIIPCIVMLTALLNSPDLDSHQYTASLVLSVFMLHVVPQVEQGDQYLSSVENLITLHSAEFPSQLTETESDSEVKCWALSGLTVRDADEWISEKQHVIRGQTEHRDLQIENTSIQIVLSLVFIVTKFSILVKLLFLLWPIATILSIFLNDRQPSDYLCTYMYFCVLC